MSNLPTKKTPNPQDILRRKLTKSPYTYWFQHNKWLTENPQIIERNIHKKLWRLQNLYPIKNKHGQLQRMILNKHQLKLCEIIARDPSSPLALLKARQIGGTTFFAIFFLDEVCLNDGVSAAIVAHLDRAVKDIFRIVTLAYDLMHPVLKPKKEMSSKNTSTEIYIPQNRSRIEVQLEIRSKTITHILWSEYAFLKEDRIVATTGAITPEALKIHESTPNRLNHFKLLYDDLKPKGRTLFVPWFHQDEYRIKNAKIEKYSPKELELIEKYGLDDEQLEFRRQKILEMTELKFRQEYPENDVECFLLSGIPVIDSFLIMDQIDYCKKNPPIEEVIDMNMKIKVFKKFTKEDIDRLRPAFFIGVDPAEGHGGDFSAACVIANYNKDLRSEVVMTLRGYSEPAQLARLVKKYTARYIFTNESDELIYPQLVVERNNHGHACLMAFQEIADCYYPIDFIFSDKDLKLGFVTTRISKKLIQADLFTAIQEKSILLRDTIVCDEILSLSLQENGSIEAEEGFYDDLFMATCLALRGVMFFNEGTAQSDISLLEGEEEDDQLD